MEGHRNFAITLSNEVGEELVFGVNENDNIFMDRSKAGDKTFSEIFASDIFKSGERKVIYRGHYYGSYFDVAMLEVFAMGNLRLRTSRLSYDTYNRISIEGSKSYLLRR